MSSSDPWASTTSTPEAGTTSSGGAGNDQFYFDHLGPDDSAKLVYGYGDGTDTIFTFVQGRDSIDIGRIDGIADPTVTATVSGANTNVHITWDASHQANITLSGVQLTSLVAGQDYHLI